MSSKRKAIAIVGPTAAGKTDVAVQLALEIGGEIINADSMQIYKGMDIGTAKPSLEQRQTVTHHLLDIVCPDDEFNAADYVRRAEEVLADVWSRKCHPIICGGTGLYIHALVDGFLFPESGAQPEVRKRLYRQAAEDKCQVYKALEQVDPAAARRLHPNDVRRVVRALEVYHATGRPISELQRQHAEAERPFWTWLVGVTRPREALYQRIDARVDRMLAAGLLEEVRSLLKRYRSQPTSLQALGYKEAAAYLKGELDYEDMVALIKRDTRRYAKRQLSWFRRDQRIRWVDLEQYSLEAAVEWLVSEGRQQGFLI